MIFWQNPQILEGFPLHKRSVPWHGVSMHAPIVSQSVDFLIRF